MTIYLAIPVLREFDNLKILLKDIDSQTYNDVKVWFCVNNPISFYNLKQKSVDIDDNRKSLLYLLQDGICKYPVTVIDRTTEETAFPDKKSGVGWARKTMMDAISLEADDEDIIISLDADTHIGHDYVASIRDSFVKHSDAYALCVPYYHELVGDERFDKSILRYEIYMRHYLFNMLRINNLYAYTALGSAMAFKVSAYRKVHGIVPRQSGEDFYTLQNVVKMGKLLLWNNEHVYPSGRVSDRVIFGTGPAVSKGLNGDWDSYPFFSDMLFDEVKETYDSFPLIYVSDLETPMTGFLKQIFKTDDLWSSMRRNYTSPKHFIRACTNKVDALRIFQYLRYRQAIIGKSNVFYEEDQFAVIREEMYKNESKLRKIFDDNKDKL